MLPESDVDLFADETLLAPWAHYAALRALGPAVRLTRENAVVLPREPDGHCALRSA